MKVYEVDTIGVIKETECPVNLYFTEEEAIKEAIKTRERNIEYYAQMIESNKIIINNLNAKLMGGKK